MDRPIDASGANLQKDGFGQQYLETIIERSSVSDIIESLAV
jgi:hypothetical protein